MHSLADARALARIKAQNSTSPISYSYFPIVGNVGASSCGLGGRLHTGTCGEAAGPRLDTRILEGKSLTAYRPAHVPYSDSAYSGRPINYPIYERASNFRAKIQEFSGGGYEVTISSINLQRFADRASMHLPRGPRTERKGDADSIEKAKRRARRMIRLKCKEMGADHLVTFTTRKTISREALKAAWGRFTDNVFYHLKRKFDYICVCEPHPSNPDHLHLHAAIRGRLTPREMVIFRRCWYVALGGKGNEKGAAAPGGFDIQHIKVRGGPHRRMDKIASYLSKYISKSDTAGFNKKRYWASKINLVDVRAYWLKATSIHDALIEFCKDFDFSTPDLKQDFFMARSADLIWMRCCPDTSAPPTPVPF